MSLRFSLSVEAPGTSALMQHVATALGAAGVSAYDIEGSAQTAGTITLWVVADDPDAVAQTVRTALAQGGMTAGIVTIGTPELVENPKLHPAGCHFDIATGALTINAAEPGEDFEVDLLRTVDYIVGMMATSGAGGRRENALKDLRRIVVRRESR